MSAIGLRVGPFEIDDEVQVPVSGNWFRAHRAGQKRRQPSDVLIRMAGPNPSDTELSKLQRYFEALRALDDSRIPSALAFYEGTGSMAVVADGGISLARLLPIHRDGRIDLDLATLADITVDILEALQHAHGKGHIHGHLSPHMITLTPKGHTWIWGFGEGPFTKTDPQWLAPDQARSGPPTVASDQWSLGALLGGLILGHAPWISDDPLGEAKIGNVDLFTDRIFKKSPELAPLIQRMMAVQPMDRHPSLGPVHQEVLALSRRAKSTSKRRSLYTLIEQAESQPFQTPMDIPEAIADPIEISTPKESVEIPNEPIKAVQPDVDLAVPEAILDTEVPAPRVNPELVLPKAPKPETTTPSAPEPEEDAPAAPDVSPVFTTDDTPVKSPLDAPPSPGSTQVGRPVPLTFQEASEGGGAKTVVPTTDAGTSIEEEDDADSPTVLYTKGLAEEILASVNVQTPMPPPSVEKPSQAPPGATEPFAITQYAPWAALTAGVILLIYTLVNIF
jgi:serine/threonine protein kinase